MKNSFKILALVCLGFAGLSASATNPTDENAPVQLPAFVVTAPHLTPAEAEIKRSLDALRALSAKPMALKIALPLPEVKCAHAQPEPKTGGKAVVVAGI